MPNPDVVVSVAMSGRAGRVMRRKAGAWAAAGTRLASTSPRIVVAPVSAARSADWMPALRPSSRSGPACAMCLA